MDKVGEKCLYNVVIWECSIKFGRFIYNKVIWECGI